MSTTRTQNKDLVALALQHAARAAKDAELETAAVEVFTAAAGDTDAISEALARLLGGLRRNPFLDAQGIIAGRILFAARALTNEPVAQAA